MADAFVSLDRFVRAGGASAPSAAPSGEPDVTDTSTAHSDAPGALLAVRLLAGDVNRLRAAVHEAFERACERLLDGLARDVLMRELQLAPSDTAALVRRALTEFDALEPLALHVCEADAERLRTAPVPIRADPSLAHGDLAIVVREGRLDARFDVRREATVARACAALEGA